jgi:uncharacterized membrane protein YhaH (DUF805 family)
MDSPIFNPIDRKTYIIGFVIIAVLSMIIGNMGTTSSETGVSASHLILPISLFFGLAKLILAYKRLKDISSRQLYLLFLVIPIISLSLNFFNSADIAQIYAFPFNNQGGGSFGLFGIFVTFSLINLVFTLFLMLKKGEIAPALPPVETKV